MTVCLLHIGKTGGTAMKALVDAHKQVHPDADIHVFPHEDTLRELCHRFPTAMVGFFVREPLQRFISGFNSRLRQGQPRYRSLWSPDEEKAFSRFPDANALAEALSSPDTERKDAAEAA